MPAILSAFRDAYPSLDVEITTGVTGYLRGLVKDGELDMVIGRRELTSSEGELIRRGRVSSVAAESSVLGLQSAVSAGLAVSCLTSSAMLDGFRKLGAREGLPALPDSELALFSGRRGQSKLMQQLATVVREYFASPANTLGPR